MGRLAPLRSIYARRHITNALDALELMNMDVQFLGYGVFIAVIIGLIMGFPSWQIRLVEATIVVASGVLTEHEATATISWWSGLHL